MRRCLKDCRHFFVALAISLSLTLLGADFLVQRNAQMRIAELQSVITLQIAVSSSKCNTQSLGIGVF